MTFLDQPLADLNLNSSFVTQSKQLGLLTLSDIMEVNIGQLKNHAAFTYIWYADLLNLLKRLELLDKFQDKLFGI